MRHWYRLVLLLCALASATPAGAALERYEMAFSFMNFSASSSPTVIRAPNKCPGRSICPGRVLVDRSQTPPVLLTLRAISNGTGTVPVPSLSGFIFLARNFTEGPTPDQTAFSPEANDAIGWGTVTGWSTSGLNWCNSEPATICPLAGDVDNATVPNRIASPFYDIGTWFFHGTGFTSNLFVWSRYTTSAPGGNLQYHLRGALTQNGSVPALPAVGLAVLSVAVLAAGIIAASRRRG